MKKTVLLFSAFIAISLSYGQFWSNTPSPGYTYNNPLTTSVGIGTSTPTSKLQVVGTGRFTNGSAVIEINPTAGSLDLASQSTGTSFIDFKGNTNLASDFRGRIFYADGLGFSIQTAGSTTNVLSISDAGTVGIGIPLFPLTARLQVEGRTLISSGSGYVDLVPATGSIELGSQTATFSYVDFKGSANLGNDFRGRLTYSDGNGFYFYTGANTTSRVHINEAGKVGIGTITPNPGFLMHVNGSTTFTEGAGAFDLFPNTGSVELLSGSANTYIDFKNSSNPMDYSSRILHTATTGLSFYTNASTSFTMNINNGKVAIGSVTTPNNYKLYVAGGILTEKVKVALTTSTSWADYVFEEDYKLLRVEEVEKYILDNNHLPGMPSTDEMLKNGNDLGQTDALLLKQIEELWLHTIELKKEITSLNDELKKCKQ